MIRQSVRVLLFSLFLFFLLIEMLNEKGCVPAVQNADDRTPFVSIISVLNPVGISGLCSLYATSPLLFFTNLGRLPVWEKILFPGVVVIVFCLFYKRFFCRWICPVGLLQDAGRWLRRKGNHCSCLKCLDKKCPQKKQFPFIGRTFAIVSLAALPVSGLLGMVLWSCFWLDPLALGSMVFRGLPGAGTVAAVLILLLIISPYFWCFSCCPTGAVQDIFYGMNRFLKRRFEKVKNNLGDQKRLTESSFDVDSTGRETTSPNKLMDHRSDRKTVYETGTKENRTRTRRRFFLGAGIGGLIVFTGEYLFHRNVEAGRNRVYFRPPGTVSEDDFLLRCIRCGHCVSRCPTQLIRPVRDSVLLFNTPQLIYDPAFCRDDCNICTEVCPVHVLRPLSLSRKKQVKLARVGVDLKHCRLYYQRECSICRRECPEEAIKFVWSEDEYANIPTVDPDLCNGCGRCVSFCPGEREDSEVLKMQRLNRRNFMDGFDSADHYRKGLFLEPFDKSR